MPPNLTDQEHAALMRVFLSPALWPVSRLAAELGMRRAFEVCETREPASDAVAVLKRGAYTIDELPTGDELRLVVIGVRVLVNAKPHEVVQTTAKRLGYTVKEALGGKRTVSAFVRRGLVLNAVCL